MTAGAAVLFWPAAPFFLLRKGKDVTINKGIVIEVFTDQVHTLKLASAPPANPGPGPAALPVAGETATVSIVSESAGAEVEVNGSFVGSTPSTQKLAPDSHRIVVRNGKQIWERTLQVQPGASVTVHAKFGT